MANELVVCQQIAVGSGLLLLTDVLKILEDLTESIRKPTIKASLLTLARDQDLVKLDEKLFVVLLV